MVEDNSKPILRDFKFVVEDNHPEHQIIDVFVDGKKANNVKSARIVALPGKAVTVLLEVIPDKILVEGKVDLETEDA